MTIEAKEIPAFLNPKIEKCAKTATSQLAIYIFDEKNRANFGKLFFAQSPETLVAELNKITISDEQFKQFQVFTSNQNEYAELFNLPPAQWMAILLEEKINGDDLAALIGSSDMFEGAASGLLSAIEEIPSPAKRANLMILQSCIYIAFCIILGKKLMMVIQEPQQKVFLE